MSADGEDDLGGGVPPWEEEQRGRDRFYQPGRRSHSAIFINGRPTDLQPLPTIDPLKWDRVPIPDRRWLVPGMVPEGNVVMLGGDGGLGKSQLALQLLVACALGKPWIGRDVRRCKVVGLFCEDDRDELHRRLASILSHYGASFADLEDLRLVCRVGEDNLLLGFQDQFQAGTTTALYTRLQHLIKDCGAELVVLDSLHDLFGGNENSRPHARQFIGTLRTLAMQMSGAVLLTAHPSLSGRNTGTGEAGSTAWNNSVRSRLYLTAPKPDADGGGEDRDYRELKSMKSNYGPAGERVRLRWQEGVFVHAEDDAEPSGFVEKVGLDNAVIDVAKSLIADGAKLLATGNAAKGLANQVRSDPRCKAFKWGAVIAAQKRLLADGKLVRIEMGPPSRRMVYVRPADVRYPGEKD